MRHVGFALVLSFIAGSACAQELEEQRFYPGDESGQTLRILSTADIDVFEPIILAFQREHSSFAIQYDVGSSTEVMRALYEENAEYDLAISSAMDLQTKLANDGFAQSYQSDVTATLPDWAIWRNQVFAFTQEPAVLVVSEAAFEGLEIPTSREELIELLRMQPDLFEGRIGTYDVRTSGLGYLFATQDSRNTESYWRLTEVMGRLNTRLYCCSGQMIADVAAGDLAIAYNVLGSYVQLDDTPGVLSVEMDDYISVMLRTAIIPLSAKSVRNSGLMIDFLVDMGRYPELAAQTGLSPVAPLQDEDAQILRPIRLGPSLLVYLDAMRQQTFLRSWLSSMKQN